MNNKGYQYYKKSFSVNMSNNPFGKSCDNCANQKTEACDTCTHGFTNHRKFSEGSLVRPLAPILKNRAKCLLCGEILISSKVKDIVTCKCQNLTIDGGIEYLKRISKYGRNTWQERSAYEFNY